MKAPLTACAGLLLLMSCNNSVDPVQAEINETRKKIRENSELIERSKAEQLIKQLDDGPESYTFHEGDSLTKEELEAANKLGL